MEKEPTLIEQKFEDAVKNFRQEMEKGKGKFSFCEQEAKRCNMFYVNYR